MFSVQAVVIAFCVPQKADADVTLARVNKGVVSSVVGLAALAFLDGAAPVREGGQHDLPHERDHAEVWHTEMRRHEEPHERLA